MDGPPDALVVFASPAYDARSLLRELQASVHPGILVGWGQGNYRFNSVANPRRWPKSAATQEREDLQV